MPSCPMCGRNVAIETVDHSGGRYLCGQCWTLFDSTDREWQIHRRKREGREKMFASFQRVDWRGKAGARLPEPVEGSA